MIKKLLTISIITVAVLLSLPTSDVLGHNGYMAVLDTACVGEAGRDASICQTDGRNPISGDNGIILRIVEILSWAVGAASVIMIIIGGLKFITSNGDSNSVASARNTVLYALIGVVVFVFSQAIVRFVISRL